MNYLLILLKTNPFRSIYYSCRCNGIILVGWGSKLHLHRRGRIHFIKKNSILYLGIHYTLPARSTIDIYKDGILFVGRSVLINRGTKIVIGENAQLNIGNGTSINEASRIHCRNKITIGEKCAISWGCNILDSDEHSIIINGLKVNSNQSISIGDHVWIGANSCILKGTIIEDNCIIGAQSLVKQHCLSQHIYAGNPAKFIKKFDDWGKL